MLHHVKVKLVNLLWWDQVFQYLMGPLDGDSGIDQSQPPGYPEDMGIYRQGRFAQREEEYTGGRFRPYPGQLPQPGFGLSYIEFIEEAQVKATLQTLNLLENELYPPGFDFGETTCLYRQGYFIGIGGSHCLPIAEGGH